jgi:glucan-binding YG repeat protein
MISQATQRYYDKNKQEMSAERNTSNAFSQPQQTLQITMVMKVIMVENKHSNHRSNGNFGNQKFNDDISNQAKRYFVNNEISRKHMEVLM